MLQFSFHLQDSLCFFENHHQIHFEKKKASITIGKRGYRTHQTLHVTLKGQGWPKDGKCSKGVIRCNKKNIARCDLENYAGKFLTSE